MTTDTRAALDAAIESWGAAEIYAASGGHERADVEAANAKRAAVDAAITAHVEAEVARRLAAAPEQEIEDALDALIQSEIFAADGGYEPRDEAAADAQRKALLAAIAADKARAVAAAHAEADQLSHFVNEVIRRVGARERGAGGQTVDAGTTRLLADAGRRIDAMIARDKARPTPDEARAVGKVADYLRQLATEVDPPRMADGFEADRMRLLAHRLRDVAAMLPDPDEARRLVDEHERAVLVADGYTAARTALLRAMGVDP